MKLALLVYLAGLSESIVCALLISSLFLGFACFALSIAQENIHKKTMIAFFAVIFTATLFPSKSTVYTMLIVSNDKVQSIGTNALDVIDAKLKEIKNAEGDPK